MTLQARNTAKNLREIADVVETMQVMQAEATVISNYKKAFGVNADGSTYDKEVPATGKVIVVRVGVTAMRAKELLAEKYRG